ncbi:cell surface protein, putative [Psychroflexus torquis ATCC 700755]|uniref:Cell surface protein, putative n=1 Tax=Psychroflexus torquis (strain ATCC 700755 / CIP 106069 / ACAM 623) TaxID=313595 RepID=K4I9A1_PSYTT|nr:DUF5074 domain-containing protein [Psychroflexus torquis]AFU67212.1 cell surface protein, putative [Psychroflexus torquis ATCC 700755]
MNTYFKFLVIAISAFAIISCSSDDDNPQPVIPDGDYFNGVLILNEGGSAGGSVSFLGTDQQEVMNDIFADANDGQGPGLFLQSIFFDSEKAYIIAGGSDLISVVNRYTFELIEEIDLDLQNPRYGVAFDGKAYVTNSGEFESDPNDPKDDFVAVIDLETLNVDITIPVGLIAERIVESNGQIFIQNGSFGSGNTISKLNPMSNTITETLEVGEGINSIQVYNQKLYALDSEGVKQIDLATFSVETEINKPDALTSVSNLRIENDQFYYTSGTAAYTTSISSTELSSEVIFDYGSDSSFGAFRGFEVNEGQIYVGDAGDFTSNGFVFIYSLEGQLVKEFSVGISPNSFYFQ